MNLIQHKPIFIERPHPPIGGKCWLLQTKGVFCLERGSGTLITIACTHAGSGSIHVIDGIPDENGFFPDLAEIDPGEIGLRNTMTEGFEFYRANPAVMGTWMLNAGFVHGLTIRSVGGNQSVPPVASVVWLPFKKASKG